MCMTTELMPASPTVRSLSSLLLCLLQLPWGPAQYIKQQSSPLCRGGKSVSVEYVYMELCASARVFTE